MKNSFSSFYLTVLKCQITSLPYSTNIDTSYLYKRRCILPFSYHSNYRLVPYSCGVTAGLLGERLDPKALPTDAVIRSVGLKSWSPVYRTCKVKSFMFETHLAGEISARLRSTACQANQRPFLT